MPNKFSPDKQLARQRDGHHAVRKRAAPQSAGGALDALLRRQPLWNQKAAQAAANVLKIELLREMLGAPLAPHVLSAGQQNGVLVVAADGAAWAGRLRYGLAALLPELQRRWPEIRSIRLKIGNAT